MAYFRCTTGGSGKGNTLVVTCADDLAGATITCTNGTKTYTKTCPSTAPYEVTFYGLEAGTWTVSATVSGNTYTTTVVITDYEAALSGFNWKTWVNLSENYTSSDFTDLDDLLSDETAIRELMTIHACVDYLAEIAAASADVEQIIENDYCAKWINNRDYALDTLYANTIIADYMDTADKYFYGEWVITDDTTTPPTWGPKGNVPVMTSNTAPYGEASASSNVTNYQAWMVFDGNVTTMWVATASDNAPTLTYKFANPICPKKVSLTTKGKGNIPNVTFSILGSNDGVTWDVIAQGLEPSKTTSYVTKDFDLENSSFYLMLRLAYSGATNPGGNNNYIGTYSLQFYGRELSVSVPTMTSNTTPYGEVSTSSVAPVSGPAYLAFDDDDSSAWFSNSTDSNPWIQYDFKKAINVREVVIKLQSYGYPSSSMSGISIEASNDNFVNDTHVLANNITIDGISTTTSIAISRKDVFLNNDESYRYYRVHFSNVIWYNTNSWASICTLQFYGLDYSEKEFEQGTTKKWLYDHGVELEALHFEALTGGKAENAGEQILVMCDVSSHYGVACTNNAIDITNYSLLRMIVGNKAQNLNAGDGYPNFGISSTKGTNLTRVSFRQIYGNDLPNNLAIDVSSINQTAYPFLSSGGAEPVIKIATATELWLE